MGRCGRQRRKKLVAAPLSVQSDKVYIRLMQWLKSKDCSSWRDGARLRPAVFPDTGRGLQALQDIPPHTPLVRIPLTALVTRCSALRALQHLNSEFSPEDSDKVCTQALLSLWLALEVDKTSSDWSPYIATIPSRYTLPYFLAQAEISTLPRYLSVVVAEQKSAIKSSFSCLIKFFPHLDFKRFEWSWFTVNTRAVYLDKDPRYPSERERKADDHLALAPYLDLLNHSGCVSVKAGINVASRLNRKVGPPYHYEIVTLTGVARYSQAFISYGPHNNTKLLSEYGFIIPDNPNEQYRVELETVLEFLEACDVPLDKREEKVAILTDQGFHRGLSISSDGLSWSLKATFYILSLCCLTNELRSMWHNVYSLPDFPASQTTLFRGFVEQEVARLQVSLTAMSVVRTGGTEEPEIFNLAESLVRSHLRLLEDLLDTSCF